MPSSFATQQVQLVKETSYGVTPGSPAYLRLNSFRLNASPNFATNPFAGSGLVVPSIITLDDEFVEGDAEGRAAYNDLGFVFASLFGAPTTTTPDATNAATARQHVWTWNGSTEVSPVSYTMERGDALFADRVTGVFFNTLSIGGGRTDGLDFGTSIIGKPQSEGATLTAGATDVVAVPINPTDMDVYMDNTFAAVGTTKLLQTYNAMLELAERNERTRPINSTKSSDGLVQAADQEHTLDLSMAVDAVSKALFAAIRAGTSKAVQIKWTGPTIGGTTAYLLKIDTMLFFTGAAYEEYNNLNTLTMNTRIGRDASANCLRITLVNTQATF